MVCDLGRGCKETFPSHVTMKEADRIQTRSVQWGEGPFAHLLVSDDRYKEMCALYLYKRGVIDFALHTPLCALWHSACVCPVQAECQTITTTQAVHLYCHPPRGPELTLSRIHTKGCTFAIYLKTYFKNHFS